MGKKRPSEGGCWYCHEDDENESLLFTSEFDANVHAGCLREALKDSSDREAKIMNRELEVVK